MRRIYLDTNFFIELCEGSEESSQAASTLMELGHFRKVNLFTSELSLAEALVEPLKTIKGTLPIDFNDLKGLKLTPGTLGTLYLEIIEDRAGLSVVEVDRGILILSAHHRAESQSLRLPDAIHLATAERTGCDIVVSGDKRLRSTPSFPFRRVGVTPQELTQFMAEIA